LVTVVLYTKVVCILKKNTLIERGGGTGPMKPGNLCAGANTSSPARLDDEREMRCQEALFPGEECLFSSV
jgi:hypothetical protein